MNYVEIELAQLPADLRWDTPPQNQGQHVTVSYAHASNRIRSEACRGARYQRIHDAGEHGATIRPENCEYFELKPDGKAA